MFGDKEDGIGPFNAFGGETEFTPILCQAEKFVCGGNFPSRFLGAGSESEGRGFGICNSFNHRSRGGNDGVWFIVKSVSSWVPMWR